VNGASGVTTGPTLSWQASIGASSYEYCYDSSNDNACSSWVNNGVNLSTTLSNLSNNTTYYWHVRAKNSFGMIYSNGSSTAFWSFTTWNVPGDFSKSSPANGATGLSTNPTIAWETSGGATSYEYCIDTSNDNACSTWVNTGSNTNAGLTGLTDNTTYYWHVRANNSIGITYSNGSTIAFWNFTTGALSAAFNKSSPNDGATGIPTNPTLTWGASGGATSFETCYDTSNDNACTSWVDAGNNTSAPIGPLSASTVYYWQVRAVNPGGVTYANGVESAYWSFKTQSVSPLSISITAPIPGQVLTGVASISVQGAGDWVELYLDGVLHAKAYDLPATWHWGTQLVSNGPHSLQTIVRNAAGQSVQSAIVNVQVNNPAQTTSWVQAGLKGMNVQELAYAPSNSSILFAVTYEDGIFKTTDGGVFWTAVKQGLPTGYHFGDLAIDPNNADVVYAGGDRLFKTLNGGQIWSLNGLNSSVNDIAVARSNPLILQVAGNNLYRSQDGGANWNTIHSGQWYMSTAINPVNPQTAYAGTVNAEVLRTTNSGSSWASSKIDSADGQIFNLLIDPINPNLLYAAAAWTGNGLHKSIDGGLTWNAIIETNGLNNLAIASSNTQILYAATMWSGLLRSSNAGQTWVQIGQDLPTNNGVGSVAVHPNQENTVLAGLDQDGIWAYKPLITKYFYLPKIMRP
jgi:hypothetical protein